MGMALVCIMLLPACHLPVGIIGKEGIGLGGRVIHFGQTESVGTSNGLLIHAGATDDVDLLVRGTVTESLV